MSRTLRHPASKGRADGNHTTIGNAVRALGIEPMDLHAAGAGVVDYLMPLSRLERRWTAGNGYSTVRIHFWCLLECKVPKNARKQVTAGQFTEAQKAWREETDLWPRIVATSGQDAVRQIRAMTEAR